MSDPVLSTVTRFAPSPTGLLHLGHAYAALFAFRAAQETGGRFLLRIEDIDTGRCRAEFEDALYEDLAWLGLSWETPVRRQSEHFDAYARALDVLSAMDILYPCFCTRKDIAAEIERSGHAPHGPDGPLYPGICRALSPDARAARIKRGDSYALRLDMARARVLTGPLMWFDRTRDRTVAATPEIFGDVVLARKETPASYHLACTLDDHIQGVTVVTRGEDLFAATHVHRLLQALLTLDTPHYHHHPLLTGETGERLAKRDKALSLRALRAAGRSPEAVIALTGL
ncbi:MAG: tRNA glutamyl-Q(34) synthetase GluQRS [Rhodospirillales bacterium]